jgi:hypothetical protein
VYGEFKRTTKVLVLDFSHRVTLPDESHVILFVLPPSLKNSEHFSVFFD